MLSYLESQIIPLDLDKTQYGMSFACSLIELYQLYNTISNTYSKQIVSISLQTSSFDNVSHN